MIDRQGGVIVIECDVCDETFTGDSNEWREVWPQAKRIGWRAEKDGDEWIHTCPGCAEENYWP